MTCRLLTAILCLQFVTGCSSRPKQTGYRRVLDEADSYEFYSLTPVRDPDGFHGWKVLGTTKLDQNNRNEVNDALFKALDELTDRDNPRLCFDPRHGIRATLADETVDLVICFACRQMAVYEYGNRSKGFVIISASAVSTFNDVLREANIPLDKHYNK